VLDGLGRYERLVERALLLDSQRRHAAREAAGQGRSAYRGATDPMRRVLRPRAANLTPESGAIGRRASADTAGTLRRMRAGVIAAGLLALACLVGLQVFLARRFRRVLALALIGATLATAGMAAVGLSVIQQNLDQLRTAKTEGFDSVLTLARARA